MDLWLYLAGAVSGMWLFVGAHLRRRRNQLLEQVGVPGTGVVVKSTYLYTNPVSVVEFADPSGRLRNFKMTGEKSGEVDIVYDPDHPKRVDAAENLRMTRSFMFVTYVVLPAFTVGCLVGAVVTFLSG